jgi:hypothetical protein
VSDDLSAVDVAATVVTVRVDTEEGMLVRAKRVVLPASLLLSCKHSPFFLLDDGFSFCRFLRLGFRNWIWDIG